MTVLGPEKAGWFPADELKVHYSIGEHKITRMERLLFGFREDGSEGVLFPTFPKDFVLDKTVGEVNKIAVVVGGDDDDNGELESKA